jgi:hypothetical protein
MRERERASRVSEKERTQNWNKPTREGEGKEKAKRQREEEKRREEKRRRKKMPGVVFFDQSAIHKSVIIKFGILERKREEKKQSEEKR